MTKPRIWLPITVVAVTVQMLPRMRRSQAAVILATRSERHTLVCLGPLDEVRMWNNVSANTIASD